MEQLKCAPMPYISPHCNCCGYLVFMSRLSGTKSPVLEALCIFNTTKWSQQVTSRVLPRAGIILNAICVVTHLILPITPRASYCCYHYFYKWEHWDLEISDKFPEATGAISVGGQRLDANVLWDTVHAKYLPLSKPQFPHRWDKWPSLWKSGVTSSLRTGCSSSHIIWKMLILNPWDWKRGI